MANTGLIGSADLSTPATDTLLTPGTGVAVDMIVNIYFCNRTANQALIRLAISSNVSPAAADYKIYDRPLVANRDGQFTGVAVSAGEKIWARSDIVGVTAAARGIPAS